MNPLLAGQKHRPNARKRNIKVRKDKAATGKPAEKTGKHRKWLLVLSVYLVLVAVFFLWRETASYLSSGELFTLRTVTVNGERNTTEDMILAASSLVTGTPIFDIDVGRVQRGIERIDWLRKVRVSRHLPDNITIEVEEYEPAGLLELEDGIYWVDPEGKPFRAAASEDAARSVLIRGLTRADFAQAEVGRRKVRRALEAVDIYRKHPIAATTPLYSVMLKHNGIELQVGTVPTTLALGHGSEEEALDRAAKLLSHLESVGEAAEVIHLDNRQTPERISTRLVAKSPVPEAEKMPETEEKKAD